MSTMKKGEGTTHSLSPWPPTHAQMCASRPTTVPPPPPLIVIFFIHIQIFLGTYI
jgi:hypothetical protein